MFQEYQHLKLAYWLLNKTLLCLSKHRNKAYTKNIECKNINPKECSKITQESFDPKVWIIMWIFFWFYYKWVSMS